MSFISVPDINCDVICTQYQYQIHLTSPWEIKSSFSLQHFFKTYQLSFWTIQIQHLLVIWGLECKSLTKKNAWSLVKKVEMTSVNGFKNIILNENPEGILVFIEVNFCWYIVVSIAKNISNNMKGLSMWKTLPLNSLISYKYAIWHSNT